MGLPELLSLALLISVFEVCWPLSPLMVLLCAFTTGAGAQLQEVYHLHKGGYIQVSAAQGHGLLLGPQQSPGKPTGGPLLVKWESHRT